jgi:hypothetical protein
MTSSFSSLESLHSAHSGRLLTLHLEKEQSIIWPSLIVGPVPESKSPYVPSPVVFNSSHELEHKYNMDPTSLVLIALELFDIRKDREEAFECFVRAWHQAHVPSATIRLVSHYLPLHMSFDLETDEDQAPQGSSRYYFQCIGGAKGLAQLYMQAGLLHLDGAASVIMSSPYSTLSSIRVPPQTQFGESGTEAWKRDREAASRYFERARALNPNLDVPLLPPEGGAEELEIPSIELHTSTPESTLSESIFTESDAPPQVRRRRKKEELALMDERQGRLEGMDNAWYLYIPGLVGAGTALLVVGVVGALSFSTWRRNQGS